jgi:signal transduction histidine kinase
MASATSELGKPAHESGPCETRAVRGSAAAILAVALGALAYLWITSPPGHAAFGWELVPWVSLVLIASVWPVDERKGSPYLALDMPILLAAAFVLGPFQAGLIALLASTSPQELKGQMTVSRCIWNHSQVALSVIAAGLTFTSIGGNPRLWPAVLVASEAALLADALVNYCLVGLIYTVGSRSRFTTVLQTLHIGTPQYFAVFYAGLGLLAAMMATLYVHVGLPALFIFLIPVVFARETLRQTLTASRAQRDLVARREALRRVDERIADERADERDRIAEALHDDVLQRVFDVTIRAHVIRECYRSGRLLELEEAVPELLTSSARVADELRDVIHGLRQSRVGHAGLISSVSLLTSHLHDQSGIQFVSDLEASLQIRPEVELVVYQVAREALVNATRHSSADTIWLSLRRRGHGVELRILDNGVGFDPKLRVERHFGLELMAERTAGAGGRIEIDSSPGNGALIVATFDDARVA